MAIKKAPPKEDECSGWRQAQTLAVRSVASANRVSEWTARLSPALRDQRVQALFGAVCRFSHLPDGFRHRDLRPLMAGLLGRDLTSYSAGAMTYDLRRLRRHGVIERVAGTQRYTLTSDCLRAAFFYTTLYRRLCQLPGADVLGLPHQPSPLTAAIHQLDTAVQQLWTSLSHAA